MLITLPYLIIHTTEPRPAALIFPPSDQVLPTKTSELLMVVLRSTVKRQLIADENCYVCRTSKRKKANHRKKKRKKERSALSKLENRGQTL